MRGMTRPALRTRLAAVFGVVSLLSCGEEVIGPGAAGRRAEIALNPVFGTFRSAGSGAALSIGSLVDFAKVRVVLVRAPGDTAVDRLVDFPPDSASVSLTVAVTLAQSTSADGEPFSATLDYITAAGTTVFRGGPVTVIGKPAGSAPETPPEIPVLYVGPGANAASIVIAPKTVGTTSNQPIAFSAVVRDQAAQVLPSTPVAFSSTDTTLVRVDLRTGAGTAVGVLGTARVIAQTLTGQADTATVTIAPATAPATTVVVTQQPTAAVSGLLFAPSLVVAVRDASGNTVTNSSAPVTAAVVSGSGVLVGPATVNAVNGVATFSTLRINGSGAHRIAVTSGTLTPDTTEVIAVTQEVAALVVTTQPSGAVSNIAFTTQPVVELRDIAGLRVIGGTASVVASRNVGPGTLYGTTTIAAVDGIVTFTDLGIEGAGSFSLRFDIGTTASVISSTFNVAAGAPGIRLRVGDSPSRLVNASAPLDFPVIVDLSNRGADDLASLTTTVTWDTTRFTYVSDAAGNWQDAQGGAATVLVNDTQAAAGSIAITGFTTNATTATFTLRNIRLIAKPTANSVSTSISATVSTAGNAAGSAVTVAPRALTVTVVAP
jgi:hypothetical protein